ncbi:WD40 repeat-like protein [Cylindrobasidium torrendii FP15055 ss-10]|uniref:WD40 repeat-like protein n=1 Tax=Cylindrobasidium torrendii FP15055 ss-10 TaxID=1314674 RepID=A0A0D7BGF8_9AGAR|nr:WD40 repeat-like protein [Cylindrobasidium torrendii FP15055 ss-10]
MEETAVQVHRCRFIDYTPSPVTALAFPPLPLPKFKAPKPSKRSFGTLAVGHANGNIDICEWTGAQNSTQSSQAWVVSKTLPGLYPSTVDSLAFAHRNPNTLEDDEVPSVFGLRLFSAGGGSELLEWDIENLCIRRTIGSQAGAIWSIAINPASTLLAMGCEDGSVRILNLANDGLEHFRRFDRTKSRLLSIAWGPPIPSSKDAESEEPLEWTDSWLVTGGSDSSLRKWDFKTGRSSERMGTDKTRGERTLVWTVAALGDGTIISGDSLGMVKFWDSRTCTQMQSFQAHGADVLALTISPEGTAVYSAGVDQKIVQFSFVKTQKGEKKAVGARRWIQATSRRYHSHDIRALSVWPPHSPLPPSHKRPIPPDVAPVLISGGLDMSLVVTPAAVPSSTVVKVTNPLVTSTESTFEDSYQRRVSYPPGPSNTSAIHVSRASRLVSCLHDTSVSVWKVNDLRPEDAPPLPEGEEESGWEKLLDMDLSVHTNLIASAISEDGKWLAVSDYYEAKLFSLSISANGDLTPKRVKTLPSLIQEALGPAASSGCLAFAFTPDSSKLLVSTTSIASILIIDLAHPEGIRVLRRFEIPYTTVAGRAKKPLPKNADIDIDMAGSSTSVSRVHRIAISSDGQWAATSDYGAQTHIFNLDALQHHCVLPSFSIPVQALAFDPTTPNILLLAFPDNSIQIYDVEARQFPAWSKDLVANVSQRNSGMHDSVVGISFDPACRVGEGKGRYALLWGSTWLCKIALDGKAMNFTTGMKRVRKDSARRPPPSSAGQDQTHEFKMITQYRPMLLADFIGSGELIVVERPLVDVLATLPPAYFKQKYGAS